MTQPYSEAVERAWRTAMESAREKGMGGDLLRAFHFFEAGLTAAGANESQGEAKPWEFGNTDPEIDDGPPGPPHAPTGESEGKIARLEQKLDLARKERDSLMPAGRIKAENERLRAYAEFVVSLDDPANSGIRRQITLTKLIEKAEAALSTPTNRKDAGCQGQAESE